MSLRHRLERLKTRIEGKAGDYEVPRRVERYMHILENAQRRARGLEPLPDLPYTEEDYEDDLKTLYEHIPAMRSNAGYQKAEGRAFLDEWERNLREKIAKGQTE